MTMKLMNPQLFKIRRRIRGLNLCVSAGLCLLTLTAECGAVASPWDKAAAALAEKIAAALGPGQAQVTVNNLSTIPAKEVAGIQLLLEQDLKAHGIVSSGTDSDSSIHVTLSQNAKERLWVGEVVEGNEKQVVMVTAELDRAINEQTAGGLILRRQPLLRTQEPVLAALATHDSLVVLEPEQIAIYARAGDSQQPLQKLSIRRKRALSRDPRGILLASPDGQGFEASLPGVQCDGSLVSEHGNGWTIKCRDSDDPWTISWATELNGAVAQISNTSGIDTQGAGAYAGVQAALASRTTALKAFYNAGRDYFTGVVTPGFNAELPPFYAAALLPRSSGAMALLVAGIDGKMQLAENGTLGVVSGARDWGSDFAVLHSGCGGGTQIVASESGEAIPDSLRAYELPAREAIAASAPLALEGTVTALSTAPGEDSVLAVLRGGDNQYEVDRVTALCN